MVRKHALTIPALAWRGRRLTVLMPQPARLVRKQTHRAYAPARVRLARKHRADDYALARGSTVLNSSSLGEEASR
jgi:hypothetical protein